MIKSVEKATDTVATIVLTSGIRLCFIFNQNNWFKVVSSNACVRKVETDLVGGDAKAHATCAVHFLADGGKPE